MNFLDIRELCCNLKKKCWHLDLLLRRIEKLLIKGATFFYWVNFPDWTTFNQINQSIFMLQLLGSKLKTFIFIHFYTFSLFMPYYYNGNEWRWMKIYENEWKCMKWKFRICCPGLQTLNFHNFFFYTFFIIRSLFYYWRWITI